MSAAAEAAKEKLDAVAVTAEQREERYDICKACPELIPVTNTCKKCGCFMAAKTHLAYAECPIGKWLPIKIAPKDEDK